MRRCDIWCTALKVEEIGGRAMALLVSMPGDNPLEAIVALTPSTVRPEEITEGARLYVTGDLAGTIDGRIWIRAYYCAKIEPGLRETAEDGPSFATLIEGIRIEKPRSRKKVMGETGILI